MNFTKKQNSNQIRQNYIEKQEWLNIFSEYRNFINRIIHAKNNNMPFIPFSDWINLLDKEIYERTTEQNKMVKDMKNELREIATQYGYIFEDANGFLVVQNFG